MRTAPGVVWIDDTAESARSARLQMVMQVKISGLRAFAIARRCTCRGNCTALWHREGEGVPKLA